MNFFMHIIVLQSFVDLGALIITQMPLPDTEVDLWRLCVDHDIQAIVILNENNEVPTIYCDSLNVLSVYFLWRCKVSLITTIDCNVYIAQSSFQELHLIPKRGSNRICAPYMLTTGNTGSDIIGLSQNTLMIAHNVSG